MKQLWEDSYQYMKSMGMESVSGTGSTREATQTLIYDLPALFQQLAIKTILDIPCGDFNWFSAIDLESVGVERYYGADIVEENVMHNTAKYTTKGGIASFMVRDITIDPLPEVDLVFCRDCLVHFSDEDVWKALKNICSTNSTYLATTNFPEHAPNNDIPTGGWRTLNLELPPFGLPLPFAKLTENCPEQNGLYADKELALWDIDVIRNRIELMEMSC